MTAPYIQSDIPEGLTVAEYRALRGPGRKPWWRHLLWWLGWKTRRAV